MQQKQAAKQLGAGVGAVHGWVRAYRKGGMAALQPKNRNAAQGNKPADSRRKRSAWLCDTGLQSPTHCLEPPSADVALTLRTDPDSPVDHLDVDVVTE